MQMLKKVKVEISNSNDYKEIKNNNINAIKTKTIVNLSFPPNICSLKKTKKYSDIHYQNLMKKMTLDIIHLMIVHIRQEVI